MKITITEYIPKISIVDIELPVYFVAEDKSMCKVTAEGLLTNVSLYAFAETPLYNIKINTIDNVSDFIRKRYEKQESWSSEEVWLEYIGALSAIADK